MQSIPVWQIAQRDYKFGKGKHSSLTRITYDAIGDKFRSLWGKEAGWAHSVLFTADLRAFSDRLSAKTEVIELKQEDTSTVLMEVRAKAQILTPVSIKREYLEDESEFTSKTSTAEKKVTLKRTVKRRRKT